MKFDFKKIFNTRHRLRSTSVPRSLETAIPRERIFSATFRRTQSYASYLDNLPVYNQPNSPKMSRAQGTTPPWRPPNSSDIRKIPIKSNEHDLYQTFLWLLKPNTTDQIVKVPLGLHDAQYDHQRSDDECKETRWEVYNIPSKKTLAILWKIELVKDTPTRVLVTPEAYNIMRPEYMVVKPQHLRRLPACWDESPRSQDENQQSNEGVPQENEEPNLTEEESTAPHAEDEEVDQPGAQCMETIRRKRTEKSLRQEILEVESSEISSESKDTEEKGTSSTEEEEDQRRLDKLKENKLVVRQQIQTRLMKKKNKPDPEVRELQEKAAQMDLESKLIKAKAEISRNQRKLGGEVRKNETLQKQLEEERKKIEKLNEETRILTDERRRNEKLQKENKSVVMEVLQMTEQLQERETQLAAEKKVNEANRVLMLKKEEHITNLRQEIEETQEQLALTRQELDRTVRITEKAIQEKDEEMEARNLQKEEEDRVQELRNQLKLALEKAAETKVSNSVQMRKKLDTVTKQLDEARIQCGQLEETLTDNQTEVEAYRTKIQNQTMEVETLNKELAETKEENKQLRASKTRLQDMLNTEKTLRDITTESLEEETETIGRLTSEIRDLKEHLERLKNKYRENKEEMRAKEAKITKLSEERQRLYKIRNTQCIKMDSLQGYLLRRGIRIPPVINGEYSTGEDSDMDYRSEDMEDYNEPRYEEGGHREEVHRIPVRITEDRRMASYDNIYDGNSQQGLKDEDGQEVTRPAQTFTVQGEPVRTQSAPGSRRNSLTQEQEEPRARTRPNSPIDQNQNSGISIIVKPGHPGGSDQVIQVIPQGGNAEPQGAYGGLERAIQSGFSSGITKITSAMANSMDKHKVQEDLIFRGTPGTISLKDWLARLELSWEPDWDDARKLKLAIKHLDRTNRMLVPIANHQHTDYQTFLDRLQMVFGSVQKPFHLSRWQEAVRYRGNKFRNWMCSHLAIELVDKTTNPWNQGELTDNEMVIVMENLERMIPKKVLAEYRNLEGSWNCQALRAIPFSQLLNKIVQDEATWENIWTEFNNSPNMPTGNHENSASYRMNSVQYSSGRRQFQTWRPQRNEGARQRSSNNPPRRNTQQQNQPSNQVRTQSSGYRQQNQPRDQIRNRNEERNRFSGRRDQLQSQGARRRDLPFSGNSFRVSNNQNRENHYNRNRQNQNRPTYGTDTQRPYNRNEGRDRQRERYQSYRPRENGPRNRDQRQGNRRINNMEYGNQQQQRNRESDDYRLSSMAQDRSFTQNQTGISQVMQGNVRTPTSSARDVGDAQHNSGYRN